MTDFNANLNEVLKYQRERLPVSAIHPELRFTRLGAVLREHATEPSDVGELAYQALTSDHKQPLELLPLHLLRDKMQEEPDHPLAKKFNWQTLPDRLKLDQAMRDWLGRVVSGVMTASSIVHDPDSAFHGLNHRVDHAVAAMQNAGLGDVTRQQVKDAADRWSRQRYEGSMSNDVEGYPEEADGTHKRLADDEESGYRPSDTYR